MAEPLSPVAEWNGRIKKRYVVKANVWVDRSRHVAKSIDHDNRPSMLVESSGQITKSTDLIGLSG